MKLSSKHFLLTVALLTGIASAQVATGTPPFGSFGGGPFDVVNLGNLNVHFSIPVLHKAGRGVPFTYNLSYDSLVWTPVTSSGIKQWQPASNWGWTSTYEAALGYVLQTAGMQSGSCLTEAGQTVNYTYQYWWTYGYGDQFHMFHSAFIATFLLSPHALECGITGSRTGTATASDGSGYTLSANLGSVTVTSRSGVVIAAPINAAPSTGSYTDANGNQITVNSSGQFFDTLSSTTPVLTVSGTAPSPTIFNYTAPSGANAAYTMNYLQYTVKTNFGVTGINEYGPLTNSLVSSIALPDGSSYGFTYEQTPGACTPNTGTQPTCVTGRIASATLPTGGTITYTYTGGNNGIESDGSAAGITRTLNPGGEWQYSRSLVTGTPGTKSTWTTTVIDPSNNYTVINAAEDASTNFYETQRQIYQGSVSLANLLGTSIRCYNAVFTSCSTANVSFPITQTDVYSQPANGSTRLSEVLYNSSGLVTDDKEYDYGVTTGSAPGTTKLTRETAISYAILGNGILNKPSSVIVYDYSSGTKAEIASTTYAYDGTAVTATTGTPQHVSVTGLRGNLTTVTTLTSSIATLVKTFTYYDTGTPNVATDVNGAQTTYVYSSAANPYNSSLTASCGNSFVTTINEPLSLSRSMQWNCTGGIAEQMTDENGQIVKSGYTDPDFWRPANVYDPENNETTISYIGETAVEAALQNFNGGNSASDSRTTVDGFGRPIFSQRKQGPTATNYDTAEVDYNNLGQPSRSTMPYSAVASPTSNNTTAPATNTTYDALGRVLTVTDAAGGTVSYTYTNNDVLQAVGGTPTGTQTFQKQFEYDGLGRLASVCEISSTLPGVGTCGQAKTQSGYWTKYTYDALGHLLTVTQNAQAASGSQQARTFTYDMLGRLLTESDPETGNSGANGTVSYTYDSISPCADGINHSYPGNLVQKKDNAGNYTCYSYDALQRVVKAGNGSVTNTILREFAYDSESSYPTGVSVSNGKTRMVEAKTINTSNLTVNVTDEFFSYSPRGELTDVYESTPHSSGYYHTTASYWPTGALETLSGIPGVPTLNYGASGTGLDSEGRYTKVTAASSTNPVTSVSYSTTSTTNPLGALTGVTYGSTDSDSFTYDPNTGRPGSYMFSVNGQNDGGTLTWNTNGTLGKLVIADGISSTSDSQTCTYTYDDLGRAGGKDSNGYSVDCGSSKWQQLFTYDAFGNISKSGTSSFLPTYSTSPPTNQFTAIPGVTAPYYDANGNLTKDNLNTYTWDAYGNMLSVDAVSATYDAFGHVVEQYNGSAYTQILYSPVGKTALMSGTTLTKAFVYLPGGGTAIYNSSGLAYYRHPDWLGSSRLTSTQAPRGLYSSQAYAPFGEQYTTYPTTGSLDPSYTGQNSDTAQSLYDFTFRRQSMSQGRWISPDPAGLAAADMTNPQSWNRYAYVLGNPLNMIDPFGLDPCPDGSESPPGVPCVTIVYGGVEGSGSDSGGLSGPPFAPLLNQDSGGAANNGFTWAWNFTKSFVGGFSLSTKPGTCLGVFTDTVAAPLKQVQTAAQKYAPAMIAAMQAGPSGAAWYMSQLNNMVASGAAEADPQVAAVVTTAGAAAATAAPYVSAAAPYLAPVAGDAVLLNGVIKEVQSGMSGQCTW